MHYMCFRQKVSENGEKIAKSSIDVTEEQVYSEKLEKTRSQTKFNKLMLKHRASNSASLIQYLSAFVYYVKARSNVYIFAFATLVSSILGSHITTLDYIISIQAVVASYFMALATYIYNDIVDMEVDKINKTNRPSVTGKSTRKQLITIVSALNGTALLLVSFMGPYTICISVLFITLGVAYSHPKLNLKDKFPLKTLVTAAGAGLLSLLGGVAAITHASHYTDIFIFSSLPPIIYASLFFFAFFFILGPLGDIGDLKGDRAVGRRTFPIVLGIRSTIMVMLTVPILIVAMTLSLTYYSYHDNLSVGSSSNRHLNMLVNPSGIYLIIGSCIATLAFILRISKKTDDTLAIKSIRPKMRFLHILLQISLLVMFL
ncbi:MAG TPA: UbiA family prenyltransferase [Nitrososphaeraceae archaeon]|nr:UbiA family prenyltransferase [Nitrososphaeraceae archaeon]